MNNYSFQLFTRDRLPLLGAFALLGILSPSGMRASEMGTATISNAPVSPGENHYTLTLKDTGTTTLGTFWFAWVPGDNFMPVSPTNITSPSGWADMVTSGGPSGGFAIQWKASGASGDLAAGDSLSGFSFDSSLTLAQLQAPAAGNPTDPVFTTFLYSSTPFSDNGVQLTPSLISSAAAPEPASIGLVLLGVSLTVCGIRKRKANAFRRSESN